MDWQRLILYIIIILTFWKTISPKINPLLKENKSNNPLSLFQETFCFCARQRCNSSNSSLSPNPLLSLLALLVLSFFSISPFFTIFSLHTTPSLSASLSPSFPPWTSPHLTLEAVPFSSSTFNILPWRSFNISPTGQNFPRLSELQRVERETPVISPNCNINSFCTAYMHIMQCPLSFSFYDNMEYYFHFCDDGSFP